MDAGALRERLLAARDAATSCVNVDFNVSFAIVGPESWESVTTTESGFITRVVDSWFAELGEADIWLEKYRSAMSEEVLNHLLLSWEGEPFSFGRSTFPTAHQMAAACLDRFPQTLKRIASRGELLDSQLKRLELIEACEGLEIPPRSDLKIRIWEEWRAATKAVIETAPGQRTGQKAGPGRPASKSVEDRQQGVLKAINDGVSRADHCEATGISITDWDNDQKALKKAGKL